VLDRSGAAGRALECRFPPYGGGAGEYADGLLEVASSYRRALADFLAPNGSGGTLPTSRYRLVRSEGGRVLVTWDVGFRTKVAIVLADRRTDYLHHRGWGVETWAQCDPAEYPADTRKAMGLGVLSDRHGGAVPIARIEYIGNVCDLPGVRALRVGPDASGRWYYRDPQARMTGYLGRPYDNAAELPADASDTGYHRGGRAVWIARSGDAAYLVSRTDRSDVERWPSAPGGGPAIGCG
jgi:hypothetical protein